MFKTNALGTSLVAEAALATGTVRRFVHCSTIAVCGPSGGGPGILEDVPHRPVSWYGASKALAERIVLAVGSRGLPFTVVRPPIVYGPRDRGLLAVFQAAARGLKPVLGRRARRYSWVYGADLAEALVVLGRSRATAGKTYFAGHTEVADLGTFVDLALAALRRRGRAVRIPEHLLALVAAGSDLVAQATGRPGMLTRDKMAEIVPREWVCSSASAERDAGWRAKTPLAEGVPSTASWYREHGWL